MKRFHVHVTVGDLAASIGFYSKLFGQAPTKQRQDYAKWMLEDPRLNFAISSRGEPRGVNHFGIQTDSAEELADLKPLAEAAAIEPVHDQGTVACCYANSEKHWVVDPQGLAWEHFFTMSDTRTFADAAAPHDSECCIPSHASEAAASSASAACC
jgi:catechol 2,3-dioxygenase-like lactoylglutathione lyase family enzyme